MIVWIMIIVCGIGLLLMTFNKKNYKKAVELYGQERAKKRFRVARYIGYAVLPVSIAGLIWDILR